MKDLTIKDAFVFGEWYNIYWFQACYFDGITKELEDRLGYGLSQMVNEQEGNTQRMYFSRSEWDNMGKKYLKAVIRDPAILMKVLDQTRAAADDLIDFSRKLKKVVADKLKADELIDWLEQYHAKHHLVWSLGMVPNVLELQSSHLTDYLKNLSEIKKLNGKDAIDSFQTLMTPSELSMAQKEEREMLELSSKKVFKKDLEKHWKKYSWLQYGWTGPSMEFNYFKDIHNKLVKEGNAKEKLNNFLAQDKALINNKVLKIKKIGLSKNEANLFRLLEEILFIKAHRMDSLYMSYEAVEGIIKNISKNYFLSMKQIHIHYLDWLIDSLKKNLFDVDSINKLSKFSVRYYDGDREYILTGEDAKKISDKIKKQLPKINFGSELRGECAFPGVVKGRAVIVNIASEMDKFKEGDILVSYSTDPSLLSIMKKATAFVTSMGGLTCHAAIVAREIGTPCVVGTKIATEFIKDGDIIEVDATRGIVKKL